MISMAGLVLIGCFQVDEASDLHFSGAVMCFILGGMYFILTTVITKQLKEKDKYFEKIYRYRYLLLSNNPQKLPSRIKSDYDRPFGIKDHVNLLQKIFMGSG